MTSWLKIGMPTIVFLEQKPVEDEVLDGGEGKLRGDVADGHLVAPAKLASTQEGEHQAA